MAYPEILQGYEAKAMLLREKGTDLAFETVACWHGRWSKNEFRWHVLAASLFPVL